MTPMLAMAILLLSCIAYDAEVEKSVASLPSRIDLRPKFEEWGLPPRRQGRRNTCSVFVTTFAFEYALARGGHRGEPLSVEYLNWACNQEIGNSTSDRGQFFHHLLSAFEKHGLCHEELMPYERTFANTPPSEEAVRDAKEIGKHPYRIHWIREWSKSSGLSEEQFQEVRTILAAGWPVAAGSNHSRLFVGYEDKVEEPGGGIFLTRDSAKGGYAQVSYQWAKDNVYDLFWVEWKDAGSRPSKAAQ